MKEVGQFTKALLCLQMVLQIEGAVDEYGGVENGGLPQLSCPGGGWGKARKSRTMIECNGRSVKKSLTAQTLQNFPNWDNQDTIQK